MTVLNTTTEDTGPLKVIISGDTDKFILTPNYTNNDTLNSIARNGHIYFTIIPKENLPVGNYSIKIEIEGQTASGKRVYSVFIAGFVVTPIPLTLTAGALTYKDTPTEYDDIDTITPLVATGYTERTANLEVKVTGFNNPALAEGLKFRPVTGLSFTSTVKSSGATMIYDVTVEYDGETTFANIENEIVLELEKPPEGYSQNAYVIIPVKVTDGQAIDNEDNPVEPRPIPINSTNILPFNEYTTAESTKGGALTKNYLQMGDIDLTGKNWKPVGEYVNYYTRYYFSGSYNGNGKTIKSLKINTSIETDNYQGLFGLISPNGTVMNLTLVDVNITVTGGRTIATGGIAGLNEGTVENCEVSGVISGTVNVGGVVGRNDEFGAVLNSRSAVSVTGADNGTGGIVGYNNTVNTRVINSHATGNVTGAGNGVGGVVGNNYGIVQGSTSRGKVSGSRDGVGGVVGENPGGKVQNSSAEGDVAGIGDANSIGGVVGYNSGEVSYCVARGNVEGYRNNVGGVVGQNYSGTVQNCNATGNVTGYHEYDEESDAYVGGDNVGGVVGENESGEVSNCTYSVGSVKGYDFVGGIVGRNTYIVSTSSSTGNVTGNSSVGGVVGWSNSTVTGTAQSYCFSTGNVEATGKNDDDESNAGGVVGYNYGGEVKYSYSGSTVTGNNENVGGVVGYNANGTVQNCYATGDATGDTFVGGVVGYSSGLIEKCYYNTTATVAGNVGVGGVVGESEGTVQYCFAKGATIQAGSSNSGGVAGCNAFDGIVQFCYSESNTIVSGGQAAGGVVGYNRWKVENCYVSGGSVQGDSHSGGIVGKIASNNPDGGGATGGWVQFCYSTSPVVTANTYVGGIVGEILRTEGMIHNCVALSPTLSAGYRILGGATSNPPSNASYIRYNTYARSDMEVNGNTLSDGYSATTDNGTGITSDEWGDASWWLYTDRWNWETDVWDFNEVSATKGPTLKDMPGPAQNPKIP